MAINYFDGWTVAELNTEIRRCQNELAAGQTVTGSAAGDVNFNFQVQHDILNRIEMLMRARSILDPVNYPPEDNTPIDRTEIVFPAGLGSNASIL